MKIDGDHVDMFPTAESIFKDYHDDILLLENRRWSMIIVFFCTSIAVGLFAAFVLPLLTYSYGEYPENQHLNANLASIFLSVIIYSPMQYVILDGFYRALAKRKLLDIIASALKMKYRRGGHFHLVSIYDHHILPPYNTRRVEEGFSGKFKGIKIEFQDFFISPVRRIFDGMGYRSIPTFKKYYGLALKVRLNKSFKHHTVLLPTRDADNFLNALPNANLFLHEHVNLVYHSFTKDYTCLSTDQIEARYVMDPAVMQRFTTLAEVFDTDRISASFMGDEMVVVMRPIVNLFEVGSLRDPVTVLTIERTLQQINALRQIAGIFELNTFAGLGARV